MSELNRDLIKKRLEQLSCEDCITGVTIKGHSVRHLLWDVISLINKQETEYNELYELCESYRKENERLMEELEKACKVNFYCSFTKSKIQNCPIDDEVAKAKADTVRKMQERLKAECNKYLLHSTITLMLHHHIDKVAKEMLEGVDNG